MGEHGTWKPSDCDLCAVEYEEWGWCGICERRKGERRKVLDLMQVLKQSIMRGPHDDGADRRQTDRRQGGEG